MVHLGESSPRRRASEEWEEEKRGGVRERTSRQCAQGTILSSIHEFERVMANKELSARKSKQRGQMGKK